MNVQADSGPAADRLDGNDQRGADACEPSIVTGRRQPHRHHWYITPWCCM